VNALDAGLLAGLLPGEPLRESVSVLPGEDLSHRAIRTAFTALNFLPAPDSRLQPRRRA
jgi:hypothetical protein